MLSNLNINMKSIMSLVMKLSKEEPNIELGDVREIVKGDAIISLSGLLSGWFKAWVQYNVKHQQEHPGEYVIANAVPSAKHHAIEIRIIAFNPTKGNRVIGKILLNDESLKRIAKQYEKSASWADLISNILNDFSDNFPTNELNLPQRSEE